MGGGGGGGGGGVVDGAGGGRYAGERRAAESGLARLRLFDVGFEFADHLQTRWNEGCHNASRLYHEIRQKGYTGKRSMVARFVSGFKAALSETAKAKAPAATKQ